MRCVSRYIVLNGRFINSTALLRLCVSLILLLPRLLINNSSTLYTWYIIILHTDYVVPRAYYTNRSGSVSARTKCVRAWAAATKYLRVENYTHSKRPPDVTLIFFTCFRYVRCKSYDPRRNFFFRKRLARYPSIIIIVVIMPSPRIVI